MSDWLYWILIGAAATLLAAAVLKLGGTVWRVLGSFSSRLRDREVRRFESSSLDMTNQLFSALGKSELVRMMHSPLPPEAPWVEIETPDGRNVWRAQISEDQTWKALALAARSHFGISDGFHSLFHRPSGTEPAPDSRVVELVRSGDRLAMVPIGSRPWFRPSNPLQMLQVWKRVRKLKRLRA